MSRAQEVLKNLSFDQKAGRIVIQVGKLGNIYPIMNLQTKDADGVVGEEGILALTTQVADITARQLVDILNRGGKEVILHVQVLPNTFGIAPAFVNGKDKNIVNRFIDLILMSGSQQDLDLSKIVLSNAANADSESNLFVNGFGNVDPKLFKNNGFIMLTPEMLSGDQNMNPFAMLQYVKGGLNAGVEETTDGDGKTKLKGVNK